MKVIAVSIILMAVLIGGVPQFTDCESQGRHLTLANGSSIPMKCHWTAMAELGMLIPLFAVGVLMVASRRRETLRSQGLIGSFLGGLVMLLPTSLIGVCGNPDMVCNSFMRPFLILTGSLVLALGLVVVAVSTMRKVQLA